jgi:predicted MFS family arabinose efflux permease
VGSIVGGVFQGARDWKAPLTRQQTGWLLAMTSGLAAVVLAPNVLLLALLLGVAGLAVAPAATVQLRLGAHVAPPGSTTEALTWMASFYYVGFAVGNAVAGHIAQDFGPQSTLASAAAFAGLATLLSFIGRERLSEVLGLRTRSLSRNPERSPYAQASCDGEPTR